jgi:hypothetical protein
MEALAANHVDINHTPTNPRFARVYLDDKSTDPFGRVNVNELFNKLKTNMKGTILVAVAYNAFGQDDGGDNRMLVKRPMFFVLDKADPNNLDAVQDCIDKCVGIAQELIGYIDEDYFVAQTEDGLIEEKLLLDFNDLSIGPIPPSVQRLCGAKVDFSFRQPHEKALVYNPTKFNTPI